MNRARDVAFIVVGLLSVSSVVHAAAPVGRYAVSNGTVRDTKTGLNWQQAHVTNLTQQDAVAYCLGQGGGWRLPTV